MCSVTPFTSEEAQQLTVTSSAFCCPYIDSHRTWSRPPVPLNAQPRNPPGFEGCFDHRPSENLMTTKNIPTDTIWHILVGAVFRPYEAILGLRIPNVGESSVSHPGWQLHFSHLWTTTSLAHQQYSFLSAYKLVLPDPAFSRTMIEALTDPVPGPHSYTAHTSSQNQALWRTLVWASYCCHCCVPREPGTRNKTGKAGV